VGLRLLLFTLSPYKSLYLIDLYGESAGIRTQDPRLKRAFRLVALTNDQVRLSAIKPFWNAEFQTSECAGLRLRHIGNRNQNRARTVTKTVIKS